MTKGNFATVLNIVLKSEGGYSDRKFDRGGPTMRGVTQATYNLYRKSIGKPRADVRHITDAELTSIYKTRYWDKVRGDDLRAGVDLTMFDFGVNSGPHQAIETLQKVLHVKIDGLFGIGTMSALRIAAASKIIKRVAAARLRFMKGLGVWKIFKGGWSRRVARIEAASLAMVLVPTQMADEVAGAQKSRRRNAGAVGIGAAGAGGGIFSQSASNIDIWLISLIVISTIAVVWFAAKTAIQNQRVEELAKAQKEMEK